MRIKPDSRSTIAKLPLEARETLESWMFDDNVSYRETAKRTFKTWGVRIGRTALINYYHARSRARALERITESAQSANAVMKQFSEHPVDTYQLVLKMAGQIAFEKAFDTKNSLDTKTIGEFIKILITARKEDLEGQKLRLERDKWEFDAARACREHAAEIQAVTENDDLDEDAQVLAIRRHLFGTNLPD